MPWKANPWNSCEIFYLLKPMKYCIAVNFQGRKLSRIRRRWEFHRENFHRLLETKHSGCGMPQNFVEKTFADGSRTSKFVKVFSLRKFPAIRYVPMKCWLFDRIFIHSMKLPWKSHDILLIPVKCPGAVHCDLTVILLWYFCEIATIHT